MKLYDRLQEAGLYLKAKRSANYIQLVVNDAGIQVTDGVQHELVTYEQLNAESASRNLLTEAIDTIIIKRRVRALTTRPEGAKP